MIYKLISKETTNLTKEEILKICILKKIHWKYGIKNQLDWFKNNIMDNDIHNLLFIDKKLVGYTALRRKKFFYSYLKKDNYLLFDTLIIDKKFRNKKLSNLLMNFNNAIIRQNHKLAFLMCHSNQLNYYSKFNWKKMHKKNFIIYDHKYENNGMVFNLRKSKYKFFIFFVNK